MVQKTFIRFCFLADNFRFKCGIYILAVSRISCLNPGFFAQPAIISVILDVLSAGSNEKADEVSETSSGFTGKYTVVL